MGKNAYHNMVCVETANAANDTITLAPGETHLIETVFGITP
jgi:D-hexose-6-phosphate mutarotase